ncbi:MAG: 50S ribosomal protein L22 [Cyanobacteria bacterium P01_H01_bin.74]
MTAQYKKASSRQKFIIMSPRKLRRVANQVRGKNVSKAYAMLRLMPYEAARIILKKLIEATSNAKIKYGFESIDELELSQIYVDEGPCYKRFKPRAQGRIYKRQKQTSHLTIVVNLRDSIQN